MVTPLTASRHIHLEDGRALRTVVAGQGSPSVVFEAGLGAAASTWVLVQRLVSAHTRTVAYDRAGLGGSDDHRGARTLPQLASDLDGLLTALGEHDPVVLVGHSWGGPIVRAFADAHPLRVAGLVLVDATITEVVSDKQAKQAKVVSSVLARTARVGLYKPVLRAMTKTLKASIPAPDWDLIERDSLSARAVRTSAREAADVAASLPMLADLQKRGLPDVPVTTVVGALTGKRDRPLREVLMTAARAEMGAHAQGRFVPASSSGHQIPLQQPDLVAETILGMLSSLRCR